MSYHTWLAIVKGDPTVPFSIATTLRCREDGIKYHFLSLWYDLTWDWTPVSWTMANRLVIPALSELKKVARKTPAVVTSIMAVGGLTRCALLPSVCNLKAAQMNIQCNLIWELMLYKFELEHNIMKVTKNICCEKDQGVVDPSIVSR